MFGDRFRAIKGQNRNPPKTCTANILQRFGIHDCNPVSTPLEAGTKLVKGTHGVTLTEKSHHMKPWCGVYYIYLSPHVRVPPTRPAC